MTTITINVDGPHSGAYSRELAVAAGQAIRALNHATIGIAPGLEHPSDVYTMLGALSGAAHGLSQLARQVAAWLEWADGQGRLGMDAGAGDLAEAISKATTALAAARGGAQQLGERFGQAQDAISYVHTVGAGR